MPWPEIDTSVLPGERVVDLVCNASDDSDKISLHMRAIAFMRAYMALCEQHNMCLWSDDPYCTLDLIDGFGDIPKDDAMDKLATHSAALGSFAESNSI